MTDENAGAVHPVLIPNPPRFVPNPWGTGLGVVGWILAAIGAVMFMVTPAATPQLDGSSIVSFPSMFLQYGLALAFVIVATGLLIAWGVIKGQEWRIEHPAPAR